MKTIPKSDEMFTSQIPAIWLLSNIGYEFISREENLDERDGKTSSVLLERILEKQLNRINSYEYKGKKRYFSDKNIKAAIKALKEYPIAEGFMKGNEYVYDLLTLGKSFEENIDGVKKGFNIKYVDWENVENNVFHVTEEMTVKTIDDCYRRPDLVLFVNGIPFVVIECKSPDVSVKEAINDLIKKQYENEIPKLFMYAQLLIATNRNNVRYATSKVTAEFYNLWREENLDEILLKNIINKPIKQEIRNKLSKSISSDYIFPIDRSVTEQDRVLYSILRPQRLLELIKNYILYDNGIKKIVRYQQYFAIKSTLNRVKQLDENNNRKGGVIWHTQGSGKSLTMVMLAKNLAFHSEIKNSKILVVTDRVNLDKQIHKTFFQCNMEPTRANSGKHLGRLIADSKYFIITTGIKKFESLYDGNIEGKRFKCLDRNIFVLIDESHRSNYGKMHSKMKRIIPNGCYIGFTGTPLKKDEKRDTEIKFKGFIHKYKIQQAVEDGAVLPLIYEGRHVEQKVDVNELDLWFEKILRNCKVSIKEKLKQKYSRLNEIKSSESRRVRVAMDVYQHYTKNFKGTKFKAMFATSRKIDAIHYKKIFDELGDIKTAVIISAPGKNAYGEVVNEATGEIIEETYIDKNSNEYEKLDRIQNVLGDNDKKELSNFWNKMMSIYNKDEESYNDSIKKAFVEEDDGPEILIVVDKLLTGFDAPRAAVLYVDKSLKEHSLLQAIARVNRLYEGKNYGYIIDYYGLFKDLKKALKGQEEFQDYYEDDIKGTLYDSDKIFNELYSVYRRLEKLFKEVEGKEMNDYELYLSDEIRRNEFYKLISKFSRALAYSYSTEKFYEEHSEDMIETFEENLKFYQKLKIAVKERYSDENDISKYDIKVEKLLDSYIEADDIKQVVKPVNIFDVESFDKELEQKKNIGAKADTIATRLVKSVEEKIKEDIYYEDFAERIKKKIYEWKNRREREGDLFNEQDYYDYMVNEMKKARERNEQSNTPEAIKDFPEVEIFYTLVNKYVDNTDIVAKISKKIHDIIMKYIIVGWKNKIEPQNNMINDIEDYLFDLKDSNIIDISIDVIDIIIEKSIDMAKNQRIYDK